MGLNDYRDEAGEFLRAVGAEDEDIAKILGMLDQEMILLKGAIHDRDRLRHQISDVLFLLMELAARFELDLDLEWENGRIKKREKYLKGR